MDKGWRSPGGGTRRVSLSYLFYRTMDKEEIKKELDKKIAERDAIIPGKAQITEEEGQTYNNLSKAILELRRKLY